MGKAPCPTIQPKSNRGLQVSSQLPVTVGTDHRLTIQPPSSVIEEQWATKTNLTKTDFQ